MVRASLVQEKLNSVDGISRNPVEGAMYAFSRVTIPQKAIDYAEVCLASLALSFVHYCDFCRLLNGPGIDYAYARAEHFLANTDMSWTSLQAPHNARPLSVKI